MRVIAVIALIIEVLRFLIILFVQNIQQDFFQWPTILNVTTRAKKQIHCGETLAYAAIEDFKNIFWKY
jgi:hypothetical protein